MQFKYLSAFLLVGACLAQVSLAESIIGDSIESLKAAIKTLTDVVTQKIEEALNALYLLKAQVKLFAQEAIASARERLITDISAARKLLPTMTDEISECIDTSEVQFQQLLTDLLKDTVECVQERTDSIFKITDESIASTKNELDAVQANFKKGLDCRLEPVFIICIIGVYSEGSKLNTELPKKIAKLVHETTDNVAELQSTFETCVNQEEAQTEAAKIVAKVLECAKAVGDNIKN